MDINLTNSIGSLNPELEGKLKKSLKAFQNTDLNPHNTSIFENNAKELFKFEDTRKQDLKSATAVSDDIIAKNETQGPKSLKTRNAQQLSAESLPTPPQGTRKEVGDNPISNNDMRTPFVLNSQHLKMTEFNPLSTIDTYWRQYKQIIDAGKKEIKDNELEIETTKEHKDPAKPPKSVTEEKEPLKTGAPQTTTEKVSARRSAEKEEIDRQIDISKQEDIKQANFSKEVAATYEKIEKDLEIKKQSADAENSEQQRRDEETLDKKSIQKDINTRLQQYEEIGKEIINKKLEKDAEIIAEVEETNIEQRVKQTKQLDTEIKDDIRQTFEKQATVQKEDQDKALDLRQKKYAEDDLLRLEESEKRITERETEIDKQISNNAKVDRELDQKIQQDENTLQADELGRVQESHKKESKKTYQDLVERLDQNTEENFKEVRANLETIGKNILKKEEARAQDKANDNREFLDEEIRKSYETQYQRLDDNSREDFRRLRSELEKAQEEKEKKEDEIQEDLEDRRKSEKTQQRIRKEKRNAEDIEREKQRRENQKK